MKIRLDTGRNNTAIELNSEASTPPSNNVDKVNKPATPKIHHKKMRGMSKASALKLPSERDESPDTTVDSGGSPTPTPSEKMKQAVRDIARGVQDTDRGAVVGNTYNRMKR